MTATVAFVLLGFVAVCILAVRRSAAEGRPSRDRRMRPLTPAFVRGVVGAAEPLHDGTTSVRAARPSDADAIESTIDDVVTGAMRWPLDAAASYSMAVRRRLAPTVMVITERDQEVAIGVVSLEPLPVMDDEAYHRTVRIGMWMGHRVEAGGTRAGPCACSPTS